MRQRRTTDEVREMAVEAAYTSLVRRLERVVNTLETMGEADMGLLHHSLARDFHSATAKLRAMVTRLRRDE